MYRQSLVGTFVKLLVDSVLSIQGMTPLSLSLFFLFLCYIDGQTNGMGNTFLLIFQSENCTQTIPRIRLNEQS